MTDAPLLMIAEGRKPRPRKAPTVREKEIVLHFRVAGILRAHGLPGWRWTHIPAGELRDARTASKLKAMGLNPGWPDFLLVSPTGTAHFLEVKRVGGKLSEDQRAFKAWATAHGVAHVVADTFAAAFDTLKRWNALGDAHV
jgi:VRR-NUC domain